MAATNPLDVPMRVLIIVLVCRRLLIHGMSELQTDLIDGSLPRPPDHQLEELAKALENALAQVNRCNIRTEPDLA